MLLNENLLIFLAGANLYRVLHIYVYIDVAI